MATLRSHPQADKILQNIQALEEAENRKHIPSILDLLSDDFIFLHADVITQGKVEARAMLDQAVRDFVSSKHIPLHIEVAESGDVGWLIGYELNRRQNEEGVIETKQYYMIGYRKVGGEWKQAAVCIA